MLRPAFFPGTWFASDLDLYRLQRRRLVQALAWARYGMRRCQQWWNHAAKFAELRAELAQLRAWWRSRRPALT